MGGVRLSVHVTPNSKKFEVAGFDEWKKALLVKVRAPPEKGKANAEVEELLSEFFGSRVEVVSGHKSRIKQVLIHGLSEKEVYDRIGRI